MNGAKTFSDVLRSALSKKSELDLNEEEMNVLRLLRAQVDIEYKNHYELSLDDTRGRRYIVNKE